MTVSIAVAGKGGSGKTTTSALIIRELLSLKLSPILAVDADGNTNLHENLGIKVDKTIGSVIDRFNSEKDRVPQGLAKRDYLSVLLNDAIAESKGFDLISMGHGAGSGCYCYPNNMLKEFLDKLKPNYNFMVLDNEAGMEHISRGTTDDINILLIVSDYSIKSIRTAARIRELVDTLKLDVKHTCFVVTQVPKTKSPLFNSELSVLGIKPLAFIPYCDKVELFDLKQLSLLDLDETSPAAYSVSKLVEEILTITGEKK